ncbi:kinetochore complex Sim4 subunit Fta1-domain-containing protein [Rhypophila decipiens]|uniref:Kinetochore complex Sim4 subunit Fta1-domain-containing protein n=1 Tax=Rhypophila decipiens TaxID=261697 RepID=A0AAN7B6X5_9PEZI|nr:kinetochore complex Sim4 subunit Fta1-domain-containing protein [Rhypophila decipiens]
MATSSQPRRRGRPAKTTSTSPAQLQSQSQSQLQSNPRQESQESSSLSESISDEGDPNFALPVFYDTSFSAYRVSPLFIGHQKNHNHNHGRPKGNQDQEKEDEEEELSNKQLGILAQRLRDLLVGDVVRGVEVGLGDDGSGVMGRYGALERVGIRWFSLGRLLDIDPSADPEEEEEEDGDDENLTTATWKRRLAELKDKNKRVLQINLEYENSLFMALLLPRLGGEKANGAEEDGGGGFFVGEAGKVQQQLKSRQFLDMPLLLLRMPPPLKSVIADFLATSFDCRVSPLRLGTRTMVSCLEAWFRTVGVPSRGPLAKDVVLWLGFHFPQEEGTAYGGDDDEVDAQRDGQLGLKTIDVSIPVSDLSRFVDAGRELLAQKENLKPKFGPLGPWGWERDIRKRRRLAGRLYEEGWEWRAQLGKDRDAAEEEREDYPFTEALGRYIDQHLGLNLFHPGVRVTKIGCGGFFMSEGKLKVFAPSNLGEEGAQAVTASSPGQRGGVLELIWGLMEKATVSPESFLA